jgi:hypothetical protein
MPRGVVQKGEESAWEEAREIVEKSQRKKLKKNKLSKDDIPWALVNHIFQQKKNKGKKKTASISLIANTLDGYFRKFAEEKSYTSEVSFEGSYEHKVVESLLEIFNKGQEGLIIFDPEAYVNLESPAVVPVMKRPVQVELDESPDHVTTFTIRGISEFTVKATAYYLASAIYWLGTIGNTGHSYEVVFIPLNPNSKRISFGWDGDGSDRVKMKSLKVNGEAFKEGKPDNIKVKAQ